jgi:hypothetical protein
MNNGYLASLIITLILTIYSAGLVFYALIKTDEPKYFIGLVMNLIAMCFLLGMIISYAADIMPMVSGR